MLAVLRAQSPTTALINQSPSRCPSKSIKVRISQLLLQRKFSLTLSKSVAAEYGGLSIVKDKLCAEDRHSHPLTLSKWLLTSARNNIAPRLNYELTLCYCCCCSCPRFPSPCPHLSELESGQNAVTLKVTLAL